MKKRTLRVFIMTLLVTILTGCRQSVPQSGTVLEEGNAVYYWRTDLHLDSTERAFLDTYHISRIYCRYFDVVMSDGEPMPNATITFSEPVLESVEIVPTVFITEDVLHHPIDSLAERIVRRIVQINETNDISGVREIQIDCDYTLRSRETYYNFLQAVANSSPFTLHFSRLSTTIRLHQLSMPEPPVDYGVLMLYNTGDPTTFTGRNPILDINDVAPYLHYLPDYQLPLGAAYPVFLWNRKIHGVRVQHTADTKDIFEVKQAVEARRNDLRQLIITYHLSTDNIQRYQPEDYEKIFSH